MRRAGANHRMDAGARHGEGSGCGRGARRRAARFIMPLWHSGRSLTTEDQSATFIELFFDLVFVYAVTQTVSLLHEDLSWAGLWHAVVVFWLVWWAWTRYHLGTELRRPIRRGCRHASRYGHSLSDGRDHPGCFR